MCIRDRLCVGQIGGPRIGAQQGYEMSTNLQQTSSDTFERYASPESTSAWGLTYKPLDPAKLNAANGTELENGTPKNTDAVSNAALIPAEAKPALIENAGKDFKAVQDSYLHGGRRALTLTSYIPGAMAIGFLGLLIYYRTIGGYKPLEVDGEGKVIESAHDDGHSGGGDTPPEEPSTE